jgi:hypothetical protein
MRHGLGLGYHNLGAPAVISTTGMVCALSVEDAFDLAGFHPGLGSWAVWFAVVLLLQSTPQTQEERDAQLAMRLHRQEMQQAGGGGSSVEGRPTSRARPASAASAFADVGPEMAMGGCPSSHASKSLRVCVCVRADP